jgi:hypothetical protein
MRPGNTVKRSTHTWMDSLYDYVDYLGGVVTPSGASGIPNAIWVGHNLGTAMVGNSTGVVGLYGFTGLSKVATGGQFLTNGTYLGPSGLVATGLGGSGLYHHLGRFAENGGSGTPYTHADVVNALKRMGALPL